jgi:hypothetical protein
MGWSLETLKVLRALHATSAVCVLVYQKLAALGMLSLTDRLDLVTELEAFAELVAVGGQFAKISHIVVASTIGRTPDARADDIEG